MVAATAPALAAELQPGLWETSGKTERAGLVTQRPTLTRCITPEKAQQASRQTSIELGEAGRGKNCKTVDSRKTDTGMTWRMQCAGPVSTEQSGSYVIDSPQHYTVVLQTTATVGARTLTSTLTIEGKRTGECPK